MKTSILRSAVIAGIVSLGLASFASAYTITESASGNGSHLDGTPQAVSSTDLINGLAPSAISGSGDAENLNSDTSGVALTNGKNLAFVETPGPNPDMTILHNGASVTYTLATPVNISEIDTFSAWRDSGRAQQNYTVSFVSTSGTAPITVNGSAGANYYEEAITGIGATGVTSITFSFPSTQNGYVGYKEFDVLGTTTPEPASLSLVGLGAIGMLARRRRA